MGNAAVSRISPERRRLKRAAEAAEAARAACITDTKARAAALGMTRDAYLESLERLAHEEGKSQRLVNAGSRDA